MRAGELIGSDRGARTGGAADIARAWAVLDAVMDPEVPVVSVVQLGIVREVAWEQGHVRVLITPTYSGCPATEVIEADIRAALEAAGFPLPTIIARLAPAWTTDWITEQGRQALLAYGIAPPSHSAGKRSPSGPPPVVACPHCGGAHTERLSEFGSTACKALYRCLECREPFDYFKCI